MRLIITDETLPPSMELRDGNLLRFQKNITSVKDGFVEFAESQNSFEGMRLARVVSKICDETDVLKIEVFQKKN